MSGLDKVVYLEKRRFLTEDHDLQQDCSNFPSHKVEVQPPPEKCETSTFCGVVLPMAGRRIQAANLAKATGSKGCHCFTLLPQFDSTKQVFPDMMHLLKKVLSEFHNLYSR